MTTYLVTGGAGFIGANLAHHLHRRDDARVVVLDSLTYAADRQAHQSLENSSRFRFVEGSVCDRALLESLMRDERPDVVMHLAAESHVDRSIDGPRAFVDTNVVGTFELLEASLRHYRALDGAARARFRHLQVSTDEVFGSLGDDGHFVEQSPYRPSSPYSATKAAADHLTRAWHHTYGLPAIVTNCSNNYGPRQFPEKLVPLMILNALEGKPLPIYGDGKNVRDWLFVGDHCAALELVALRGAPGETYCVGGRAERTNVQIVETICDVLQEMVPSGEPYRRLVAFVKDRPGHDRRYAIDAAKIERELGWSPETSFEKGIRATIGWYLEQRAWCERITSTRYARERLGGAK